MFGSTRLPRLDDELRALVGTRDRLRLERLAEDLRHRSMAVSHSRRGWSAERLTLVLDGGVRLRLKLFWRPTAAPAALLAIAWNDDVGWMFRLRSTSGDNDVLYAWSVRVDVPSSGS